MQIQIVSRVPSVIISLPLFETFALIAVIKLATNTHYSEIKQGVVVKTDVLEVLYFWWERTNLHCKFKLLTFVLLSNHTMIYMCFLNLIPLVIFERQDLFGLNKPYTDKT